MAIVVCTLINKGQMQYSVCGNNTSFNSKFTLILLYILVEVNFNRATSFVIQSPCNRCCGGSDADRTNNNASPGQGMCHACKAKSLQSGIHM